MAHAWFSVQKAKRKARVPDTQYTLAPALQKTSEMNLLINLLLLCASIVPQSKNLSSFSRNMTSQTNDLDLIIFFEEIDIVLPATVTQVNVFQPIFLYRLKECERGKDLFFFVLRK